MAKIISYTKILAEGELTTDNFGTVYYEIILRPVEGLDTQASEMFKNDLEDFEFYLMQKYVTSKQEIDKFPIWKKLKNAIKNIR